MKRVKVSVVLGLLLCTTILLTGCLPNIEINVKGSKVFGTFPDYPHVFTLSKTEMDVEFVDQTTRIFNPETGDPFLYMIDRTNFYIISGIQDNLKKVLASEGRIQFGFFTEEPRYAEAEAIDFVLLPIDEIIKITKSEHIILEFVDASNGVKIAEHEIDLTAPSDSSTNLKNPKLALLTMD